MCALKPFFQNGVKWVIVTIPALRSCSFCVLHNVFLEAGPTTCPSRPQIRPNQKDHNSNVKYHHDLERDIHQMIDDHQMIEYLPDTNLNGLIKVNQKHPKIETSISNIHQSFNGLIKAN